jgi:hypothetical protein
VAFDGRKKVAPKVKYQRARQRIEIDGASVWVEVRPRDIVDRPAAGDLVCLKCDTTMTWVQPTVNKRGTDIPAHLRLGRGRSHSEDCELNFRTVMEGLRASKDDPVELRDRKFFLRLPGESIDDAMQRTSSTKKKRTNAPSWATTFGSATRIAKLLREFTDDSALANELRVEYRDPKGNLDILFWADFCFRPDQLRPLVKYYNRLREATYRLQVPPIAIEITLDEEPRLTQNGLKRRVTVRPGAKVEYRDSECELVVSVYSADYFGDLHAGDTILVLAHGDYWHRNMDDREELRLDVEHAWQIARL